MNPNPSKANYSAKKQSKRSLFSLLSLYWLELPERKYIEILVKILTRHTYFTINFREDAIKKVFEVPYDNFQMNFIKKTHDIKQENT